jgi:hypothetical protein
LTGDHKMEHRPIAKALFFIVLSGIVVWQLPSMIRSDPVAEQLRLQESCSPRHEDIVKWQMITGSFATAMDLGDAMQHLCLTGTPRSEAIEAVNATVMPRRRI